MFLILHFLVIITFFFVFTSPLTQVIITLPFVLSRSYSVIITFFFVFTSSLTQVIITFPFVLSSPLTQVIITFFFVFTSPLTQVQCAHTSTITGAVCTYIYRTVPRDRSRCRWHPGRHIRASFSPLTSHSSLTSSQSEYKFSKYTYVRPSDELWGVKLGNGSWSGMVGMVMRKEVEIGVGPFSIHISRTEVVDFTVPIMIDYYRIIGARGHPEVDPWGFVFPMAPLVWAAILATLMVLVAAVFLMSVSVAHKTVDQRNKLHIVFDYVRILLQQDMTVPAYWWWERVMLVLWMMVTLVLTRSYSGNLMALLAVRHISQPYQSLQDVVDDPSVKMIWEKGSNVLSYLDSAESGIYREIADTGKVGRLIYITRRHFSEAIDTVVRQGDHVLMLAATGLVAYVAQDFTKTGKCSFYGSREEFLQIMFAMIGQKDSPIIPALNKRIMSTTEAGLFFQWVKTEEPNSTVCYHSPSKILVNSPLSIKNIWGMFVILFVGLFGCLVVLCLELFIFHISKKFM
nr:probable glutamate receptor [Cherax quadricarinatus]